ncbi:tyrosine-type recombinase/integrase [Nonomuraea muscovyensis]|uniref:tyrosine-type recombinase/integrase n=1 Tax=Nonomuraea muscovyensis TaxID=1124761 RepID=UPI0028A75672|nr:tyrosine-type recombinase/integrase [Nonomuraea muscovyensis]
MTMATFQPDARSGDSGRQHSSRPTPRPPPIRRLHDLRHVHASLLLLAGVPVHVVAARLGHADPAIILRVYAHVIRSAETAAADVFAAVITSAGDD